MKRNTRTVPVFIVVTSAILLLNSCTRLNDPEAPEPFTPDLSGIWNALPNAPAATDRKHDDLFFIDMNTGWTVTRTGSILKTTDGGGTWNTQYTGKHYFRAVGFADAQHGWAANLHGDLGDLLFQTTDGGTSWTQVTNIPSPPPLGICGIWVVDRQTIFAAGRLEGPSYLLKSNDGGASWKSVNLQQRAGMLIDVHFWTRTDGMVIGGTSSSFAQSRMIVLTTTDAGETWTERFVGARTGEWGWKISFPTRSVGYASIQTIPGIDNTAEYFLKTTDGGVTWAEMKFYNSNYSAQGIGFLTPEIGWIGSFLSEKPILLTTDGGNTWQEDGFGILNRFRFIDGKVGYASGGTIYKRTF